MDHSIFMDMAHTSTAPELKQAQGDKYPLWMDIFLLIDINLAH